MRRRQLYEERARQLMEEEERKKMAIDVPNSNIISKTAQPALKEKANMFLPHPKAIKKPNGKSAGKTPKGR